MHRNSALVTIAAVILSISMISGAGHVFASAADFTTSCTQSGSIVTCTATDNDGAPGGHENGAFVVFIPTSGASNVAQAYGFCAWTATASTGATTPVNCRYSGTFGGVGTSALVNTGGAKFTVVGAGSVTFGVIDCVAGSGPSSSQSAPCGTGANVDGSDCKTLGDTSSNAGCAVIINTTVTHGVPEFAGGSAMMMITAMGAVLLLAFRKMKFTRM